MCPGLCLTRNSCYGICHDMKEWSVENESSFAKINMMVVEGFCFYGKKTHLMNIIG